MLLKQLELQGFKTFPDKTTLDFKEGITAVVGPNGSGKSNISDAIRWVLGEQSTRILRCSKMEDVVFNGTTKRKSQGFARVTLTIDNKDRRLPFDEDEVSVTRRYYRSGESEYLINNATVRLKDINELFMDTGLGRDGYSIIGQGKIDEIVSSKANDRREIFEEAAGISRYRYRKTEAERRLQKTEDNLIRLRDILKELEERVGPLKVQSEKAKQYLELSQSKKDLEIALWVNTLKKSAQTLIEQEEKIKIAYTQSENISEELQKLRKENEEAYNKTNICIVKADEIRRKIEEIDCVISENNKQKAVIENEISHIDENINSFEEEIKKSELFSEDFDKELSKKQERVDLLHSELLATDEKIKASQQELFSVQETITKSLTDNEVLRNEFDSLNFQLSQAKLTSTASESSIAEIELQLKENDKNIKDISFQLQELDENKESLLKKQEKCHENIAQEENSLKGTELKLSMKNKAVENLKEELNALTLDMKEKERRAKILSDMEKNLEGFQYSVKAIVEQKQRGTIAGIHGPVSRLFKVSQEYSVAIETALGPAMQHIVVDNEQNAKACIRYLKQNRIGRATFLPLNTIKGRYIDISLIKNEFGFVDVASKLCSCDEQYKEIISSLLGGIVVAEDLDSATQMARKASYRFKIVTLDGQVINAGGSLTGGALVKNAGILSRGSEIDKLKEQACNLQENIKEKSKELEITNSEYNFMQNKVLAYREKLNTLNNEKVKLQSEVKNIEFTIASNMTSQERLKGQKSEMLSRLQELKGSSDKSESTISKLQGKIKEIEAKMNFSGGEKDKLALQKEDILEKIKQRELEKISLEKDIESLKLEILSIENRKIDKASMINEYKLKIEQNIRQREKIKEESLRLEKTNIQMKNNTEDYRKEIEKLNEERMKFEKQNSEFRKKEQEKLDEKELIVRDLAKLEERKQSLQINYDDIIAKLWDEYELTRTEAESQGKEISNVGEAQRELNTIKAKIKSLGNVNVAAVEEYKEVNERYEFMKTQVEDVESSKKEIIKLIRDLTSQMKEIFIDRFQKINKNFNETYKELTEGGRASLHLSEEDDVLNSGIEIEAEPKGKIVTRLELLSGGEKALVAISLYFAIMKVNPAPFCVLDEIEAALDDVNVDRFAAYLRKMNDNTQFITITHRRGTMEGADIMYGVTMQDEGVSKLLSLDLSKTEL